MNQAGNDVLAGAAFAVNEDRDIGRGYLVETGAEGLHDLRLAKNHGLGRNFAQRLR